MKTFEFLIVDYYFIYLKIDVKTVKKFVVLNNNVIIDIHSCGRKNNIESIINATLLKPIHIKVKYLQSTVDYSYNIDQSKV